MPNQFKSFQSEIKEVSDAGEFEAVIATLGVIDTDDDIIEKGAFSGATIAMQPAHDNRALSLGKGRVVEVGDQAIFKGKFNLETQSGREWHSQLKFDLANLPAVQEWSFGFMTLKYEMTTREGKSVRLLQELKEFEVSPVLLGAGIGTGTLGVKNKDEKSKRLIDQCDDILSDIDDMVERVGEIRVMRKAKGKDLSADRIEQIKSIGIKLEAVSVQLKDMFKAEDEEEDGADDVKDEAPTLEEVAITETLVRETLLTLRE